MKKYTTYRWALLYGLYFYILFQLVHLVRFGRFNTLFNLLDLGIYLVGVCSVVLCTYYTKKLQQGKYVLWAFYILAIPFGYIGALAGGLLGIIGVVIYGLVPFLIFLLLGYWIIKKVTKQ